MATASDGMLPVDVIFHPDWWHTHYGLDFREPFHFDPGVRVESLHDPLGKLRWELGMLTARVRELLHRTLHGLDDHAFLSHG